MSLLRIILFISLSFTTVISDWSQRDPAHERFGRCGADQATCQNGECVARSSLCDGQFDCRDQSDEANCGPLRKCEPNEFLCRNGLCVQKMWVCDREDDCGDNSDENDCGTPAPGHLCGPRDFECKSGRQCIPRGYQCDGQNDCQDGSDEHGCSDPVVVQPPPPQVSGCLGQTVTIFCRAVGVPVPHITWRLNWGPVCDAPRCTQTSENGEGTLTIHNVMERDQGAYTCEVLNSRKRLLAVPDAILTVKDCGGTAVTSGTQLEQPSCNPAGTLRVEPSGRCVCKAYTVGANCDQCLAHCFFLSTRNPNGCIRCFCMGVSRDCSSANLYRNQERLSFRGQDGGVMVSDFSERQMLQPDNIDYSSLSNGISVTDLQQKSPGTILYWRLPASFLGNKIGTYGGFIKFTIRFTGDGPEAQDPLLVLKGNEITLVHKLKTRLEPNVEHPVEIPVYETSFVREDGEAVTHEHLLMTLANLESFLIRHTHCQHMQSSSLGEVSMDIAVGQPTGQDRALGVEHCTCPDGYIGTSCEECAPGYERSGGGLYLGICVRAEQVTEPDVRPTRPPYPQPTACDIVGSVSPTPDRYSGRCICKEHVTGSRCDQCKAGSYLLHQGHPQGCIPCFCAGVSRQCVSSSLYRQERTVDNFKDWVRAVRTGEAENFKTLNTPAVASDQGLLIFDAFHEYSNGQPLYISLPDNFLNNKISAYGGKIRIRFSFGAGSNIDDQNPCVILRGNDIALYHTTRQRAIAGRDMLVTIPIYESHFLRYDKRPSSREHLIMALAHLDEVLIKISWAQNMRSFVLHEVTFDHASHVPSHLGRATSVEQCRCPVGYIGSSCESCSSGYSRTGGGLYLGLCEPCFCNGHSDECDPETGECQSCQHNTQGHQCERCASGYSGDAQLGTPHDCRHTGNSGQEHGPAETTEIGDHGRHTNHDNGRRPDEREHPTQEPGHGSNDIDQVTEEPEYPTDLDSKPERGDTTGAAHQPSDGDNEISGSLRHGCRNCECHNHSPNGCDSDCNCLQCLDNTVGKHCELCEPGYYGDAAEGTPYSCQQCPCPIGVNCSMSATEGNVICHCPQGYGGLDCADCALGFKSDPEHSEKCVRDTLFHEQFRKVRKGRRKLVKKARY